MSVPAIKALSQIAEVSVMIGSLPDDRGSFEVMNELLMAGIIKNLYIDKVLLRDYFDIAVMSIPFDGRWQNGVHFNAHKVIDGRTRPDPTTTGLVSWKKHELEYQYDNIKDLGYSGGLPSMSFLRKTPNQPLPDTYYFGVGYKKDEAGFWKIKHWGNENYAELARLILDRNPHATICMTGDEKDYEFSISHIVRDVKSHRCVFRPTVSLMESFRTVVSCRTYIGNDTGMMHVAASENRHGVGLFFLENSIVKNRPWCDNMVALDGSNTALTPELVFDSLTNW